MELDDLRWRLNAVRWPERETVDDWAQGVPLNYIKGLCAYWLPRNGASSARLYWESIRQVNELISGSLGDVVDVPTGVLDLSQDRGGHFAAFEQPELFVDELRAFFGQAR